MYDRAENEVRSCKQVSDLSVEGGEKYFQIDLAYLHIFIHKLFI